MNLQLLDSERFLHLNWRNRHPQDDQFVSVEALIPIYGIEAEPASACMPLAIVEGRAGLQLCAVCSIRTGHNVFVHGSSWESGIYRPIWLEQFPFSVAPDAQGMPSFWVEMDNPLIVSEGGGLPFYDQYGEFSDALHERLAQFPPNVGLSCQETTQALNFLIQNKLLIRWPTEYARAISRNMPPLWTIKRVAANAMVSESSISGNASALASSMEYSLQHLHRIAEPGYSRF